eukprot:m.251998 g.251998  ORF g.251998 m.251998 type:complete len:1134 (+) comp17524_c0_seq5:146-3547(+)
MSSKAAGLTGALALCATLVLVWLAFGRLNHPSWRSIEQQDFQNQHSEDVIPLTFPTFGGTIDSMTRSMIKTRKAVMGPELTLTMQRNAAHTKSRLLVAIISGGSNESLSKAFWRPNVNLEANKERAANRDAILATWASDHTYFVTHEEVDTTRIVSLSAKAEVGGRDALPRKSMRMWQQLWEEFGPQGYEWFMKADDDTYINMDRLSRTLSLYRSDVPVILGGRAAPVSKPYASFCQGGRGIIMSRAALEAMAPVMDKCFTRSAFNWEDLWLTHCFSQRFGMGRNKVNTCMDLTHVGFDPILRNGKDQDANRELIFQVMNTSKTDYLMQHTYHSLYSEMQLELHHNYSKATQAELDKVDKQVANLLLDRPQETTTNYRCEQLLPNNDVAEAICTDWMLQSRQSHPSFVDVFLSLSPWAALTTGRATRQALLMGAAPSHAQPLSACIMPRVCASEPCPEPPTTSCRSGHDSGNRFIVTQLVNCSEEKLSQLQLLSTSLAGVDRVARLAVLAPAEDQCYEKVVQRFEDRPTVLTIEYTMEPLISRHVVTRPPIALTSFLQHLSQINPGALVMTVPVDTFFQSRPWLNHPDKLVLFTTPPRLRNASSFVYGFLPFEPMSHDFVSNAQGQPLVIIGNQSTVNAPDCTSTFSTRDFISPEVLQGRPDHIATALALSLVQLVQRKTPSPSAMTHIFDKTAKQYILAKHLIDTVQYAAWDSPATVLRSPVMSESLALQHDPSSGVIWLSSQLQDRDAEGRVTITNLKGKAVATVAGYSRVLTPSMGGVLRLSAFAVNPDDGSAEDDSNDDKDTDEGVEDQVGIDGERHTTTIAPSTTTTKFCNVASFKPVLATAPRAIPRLALLSGLGCPVGKHVARMLAQAGALRNSTFFRPFGGFIPAIDRFQLIIPSLRWPYWYEGNIDMVLMPWSVGDATDKIADGLEWLMGPNHLKIFTAVDPVIEALASKNDVQRLAARIINHKFKPGFHHLLNGLKTEEDLRSFLDTLDVIILPTRLEDSLLILQRSTGLDMDEIVIRRPDLYQNPAIGMGMTKRVRRLLAKPSATFERIEERFDAILAKHRDAEWDADLELLKSKMDEVARGCDACPQFCNSGIRQADFCLRAPKYAPFPRLDEAYQPPEVV